MKKSPSPAPILENGFERHQFVFFMDKVSFNEFTARGGLISELLFQNYGLIAFYMEFIQNDEKGVAFHCYEDRIIT
jgi:hypothetical protein